MTAEFLRDAAMTAVIFGVFASSWFGWAQEDPPPTWRKFLTAGAIASVLTAVAGGVLAWQHWQDGSVFDADTSRTFGVIVGIEFAAAAIGAGILEVRRKKELIPAWIALVVGVHLFPVAALLGYPLIHVVGAMITVVALVSIPRARARELPVSAVTGLGAGTVLLAGALLALLSALFWP